MKSTRPLAVAVTVQVRYQRKAASAGPGLTPTEAAGPLARRHCQWQLPVALAVSSRWHWREAPLGPGPFLLVLLALACNLACQPR